MISPCPKHVLCPTGTGTDSPGVNYSSEVLDVPEFRGHYYPPNPYGYYTACMGRCISLVSQLDADLCAQRLVQLCLNNHGGTGPGAPGTPKPVFCNTPQSCTEPNTGRIIFLPADLFCAGSQAEADAQALSFANLLQKDPNTPPGPSILPSPGPTVPPVNTIPTPSQPHKQPPPPASQCKPCDDTGAVGSFSVACNVPAGAQTIFFESPTLKCGKWMFTVVTNNPGSIDDGESYVVAWLAAANPSRTMVPFGSLTDCPLPFTWRNPCGNGVDCDPQNVLQWGLFPGCCSVTSVQCSYAQCQTLFDGNWMTILMIEYNSPFPVGNSAKKFTVNGTWLGPVPP